MEIATWSGALLTLLLDGFFDAGMLLQALKANKDEPKPSEVAAAHKRRAGTKLPLSEY